MDPSKIEFKTKPDGEHMPFVSCVFDDHKWFLVKHAVLNIATFHYVDRPSNYCNDPSMIDIKETHLFKSQEEAYEALRLWWNQK